MFDTDVFKLPTDLFSLTMEEFIDITGVIKYVFNNLFAFALISIDAIIYNNNNFIFD
jgi:hypothetical protein